MKKIYENHMCSVSTEFSSVLYARFRGTVANLLVCEESGAAESTMVTVSTTYPVVILQKAICSCAVLLLNFLIYTGIDQRKLIS